MRYVVVSCVALFLAGATPCKAHAQIEGPVTALIAGVALDKIADRLEGIVGQATKSGDYIVEKNARLLQGLVTDARIQLEEVLDKKVGELKLEHRNFLATLNTAVEEIAVKGPVRVMELQDFLALDLENTVRQLPGHISLFGGKDLPKLSFRRLDGYSVVYQKEGVYSFRLIGAAFGPDYRTQITVNGAKVKLFDIKTPRNYLCEFDVPVEVLNEKFADSKVERADIKVESFAEGKEKPVFSYTNQILLLPKSPVAVKITERYKAQEWSKELYDSVEGSTFCPKTGQNNKNTFHTVSTKIPAGHLMVKDSVQLRMDTKPEGWFRWGAITFSDADTVISSGFMHGIHDLDRTIFIKVKYRKPVFVTREREVAISGKTDGSARIPFGPTFVDFTSQYESFTVEATWFTGRKVTLIPEQLTRPGIKLTLQTLSPPRLMIDLAWPEFSSKP